MKQISLEKRIKMIKAMEYITRQINDEEVFETWLMFGVADGDIDYGDLSATDGGSLDYYAEDGVFSDLMDVFLRCMREARESGGLYCDGILSEKY